LRILEPNNYNVQISNYTNSTLVNHSYVPRICNRATCTPQKIRSLPPTTCIKTEQLKGLIAALTPPEIPEFESLQLPREKEGKTKKKGIMKYLVEAEGGSEGLNGAPSAGPAYRSVFAKDGYPPPTPGLDSCWDAFTYFLSVFSFCFPFHFLYKFY
jgi:hypothetical protein